MSKKTVIFGYSGHALVVNDCLQPDHVVGAYVDRTEKSDNPLNIIYLGSEADLNTALLADHVVFPAVGDNNLRKRFRLFFTEHELTETRAIHTSAAVSSSATIGLSTMIGPNAVVNAHAVIGNGVIVNSRAIVEHECKIADYVHIAPGAVLAGNVTVGEGTFIGANSTVKEGIHIGKNCTIGAGSVVLQDIMDNELWAGTPAIKKKDIAR